MRHTGFEPFIQADSKILILGSFPSVKSREEGFYYGHPRNRFWTLLATAYGEPVPETVEQKKDLLVRHRIALYDTVAECEIKGSLDSAIKNYAVADLRPLLRKAKIERIILNGNKARDIFKKNYSDLLPIAVFLPSTSPLNTRLDASVWLNALTVE